MSSKNKGFAGISNLTYEMHDTHNEDIYLLDDLITDTNSEQQKKSESNTGFRVLIFIIIISLISVISLNFTNRQKFFDHSPSISFQQQDKTSGLKQQQDKLYTANQQQDKTYHSNSVIYSKPYGGGSDRVLNISEIRWCIRQKIALDYFHKVLNSDDNRQIDDYNCLVDDYNTRCGKYRYKTGRQSGNTLSMAQTDVDRERQNILGQVISRARMLGRQGGICFTVFND